MNRQEQLAFLQAELAEISSRLDTLRVGSVGRAGLEHRAREVEGQLTQLGSELERLGTVDLTFGGSPVIGTEAVQAGFAARALEAFDKAVATVSGSLASGPLSSMGPIPSREDHRMFVTALARGSFGFHLEEKANNTPTDVDSTEPSVVSRALASIQELLDAGGDDERVADAAVATDLRVLANVRQFVELLARNNAVCTLSTPRRRFRFTDVEHVQRVADRLSADNLLREEEQEFEGQLYVLPLSRQFELSLASGEILRGRVDESVPVSEIMLSHTHRVRVRGAITSVGRGGRAKRLLLQSIERLPVV